MATANKNGKKAPAKRVATPAGFFAYLHVYEPNTSGEYPSGKFEAVLVAKKADPQWKELRLAQLQVAREKWGKDIKYADILNHVNDGDERAEEQVAKLKEKASKESDKSEKARILANAKHWDKWRGCYFIKAKLDPAWGKPGITGAVAKEGLPEGEDVQGGDFGRMTVVPFGYEKTQDEMKNGKKTKVKYRGVSFRLGNLQKQGTGERFKGTTVGASEDFDDIEPLELEDAKAEVAEDEEFEEETTAEVSSDEKEEEIFG